MSSALKEQQLKSALKEILKNKGLQYKDLADELGCSVPTVKRFLTSGDLDLNRLLRICEILDVTFAELEKVAEVHKKNRSAELTLPQEEFLSKNLAYLTFLTELYSGVTPEQIAKKHGLTKRSLELYLLRLEKIGLLKGRGGRFEKVHKDFPNFIRNGPILKSRLTHLLDNFNSFMKRRLNSAVHNSQEPKNPIRFSLAVHSIPIAVFKQWEEKFNKLLEELDSIAQVYQKAGNRENLDQIIFSNTHVALTPKDPDFDNYPLAFGRIENLP